MNTTAKLYTTNAAAQLPRAGHQHLALVAQIRRAEGDVAADRAAVDALERPAFLLDHAELSDAAHALATDLIDEARTALLLRVWPRPPP